MKSRQSDTPKVENFEAFEADAYFTSIPVGHEIGAVEDVETGQHPIHSKMRTNVL
jgi:hypothetical protein